MNQLIPTQPNEQGNLLVSGRDLHEFLESNERYSKWFDRMRGYGFVENIDFTSGQKSTLVNNGAIRELEDHLLTVNMAKEISMLQRNEKGKQARQYFLDLERKWNSPEMVIKRAHEYLERKVEALTTDNLLLTEQVEKDKPKVLFADAVTASKTSILIGELAKLLKQNGVDTGQQRLFQWMRDNGYLIRRKGTDYNMPTQRAMELGLFEIKESAINHSDGHVTINKTPKVTGKGQVYFINKFKEAS